ncbi:hypothetical protein [Alistipes sp.]|uniref:hypothetical protein n=1 Tax=Alistipes sp. TaxID=1872444 RepID=UPI003AB17E6C
MEVLALKPQLDGIQELFNRCINHAYRVLTDRITAQSSYLDHEQMRELEQQEYIRTADELAELYLRHSVLSDIRYCYSDAAFLWESSFFEALNADEKKKYRTFSLPSFDYSRYECEPTIYDVSLPYFSVVVQTVVLERYAAYLGDRKKTERCAEENRSADAELPPKAVPPIAETDNPFDSTLTEPQVAFLAEAVNDVKMFNVPLTADDLAAILAGKPHAIVRSNNNRLVAFFFSGLSSRGLITPNWQSVIANYKLFLSKDRSRDKYINQSDLSTATNYIRDVGAEGKYATIEKYLKQVKKL